MSFELNILDYVLIGLLLLVTMYQLYFYLRYIGGILWRKKSIQTEEPVSEPGVSVIVCARNEQQNLDDYLQALLTQDYAEYEVIVVDDGSEDASSDVMESYVQQDKRLHRTFVPRDAHVGSTKKLGLTLAAKAAKYDYLLLTDADCRPESNQWIRQMMSGFRSPQTGIVLGFGAYFPRKTALNRLIQFDTLFNGLHYLGAAATGRPYMGVGRNLSYRKDLFFNTGGFTKYMTCRSGDDDLFVNHVANRRNTAVVTTPESITWSIPKESLCEWLQQKRRHLSVSPRYTSVSKLRLGFEPLSRALFYALLVAVAVFTGPMGWIVTAATWTFRTFIQLLMINLGAKRLIQPRVGLMVICYDLCLPLLSLFILLTQPLHKASRW